MAAPGLTAAELGDLYASGDLTPIEVVRESLDRIGRLDAEHSAIYVLDAERALVDAEESTRRWAEDRPRGPLDGVPFTAKENQAREGLVQSYGTAGHTPAAASADAPTVQRMREAGAVYLASTTMPDLSGLASGVSSRHGVARNAWNRAWNTGGSSSGAGVAAALGYAPINIGTDIGGSIRVPASFEGVVGFKPTFGRVPITDTYTGRVAGPLTRTVADAALAMSVLAQPDLRDWSALPYEDIDWSDLSIDVTGLRVGVSLEPTTGRRADPAIEAAVERAAVRFRDAGAEVGKVEPYLLPSDVQAWTVMFGAHLWAQLHDPRIVDDIDKANPAFVELLAKANDLSSLELMRNIDRLQELIAHTREATEPFDIVLSPVTGAVTGAADSLMLELMSGGPTFTSQHNATGAPAASVNAGFTAEGKPIGLHISGKPRGDLAVLRAAQWFEANRDADAVPDWARLDRL